MKSRTLSGYGLLSFILIYALPFMVEAQPAAKNTKYVEPKCISGDCRNGYGVYRYAKGTVTKGQWKNGMRNGHCVTTTYDGQVYEGDYINDLPEGQGSFTYADGKKYVGDWKNGNFDGQGIVYYPNGARDSGLWVDNELVDGIMHYGRQGISVEKVHEGSCFVKEIFFYEGGENGSMYKLTKDATHKINHICWTRAGQKTDMSCLYNEKGDMEKVTYTENGETKVAASMEYNIRGLPVRRTNYSGNGSYSLFQYDKQDNMIETADYSKTVDGFRMMSYTKFLYDDNHTLKESQSYAYDKLSQTFILETKRKYEIVDNANPLQGLILLFGANELTLSAKVIDKKFITRLDNSTEEIAVFHTSKEGFVTEVKDICRLVYACE